MSEQFPPRFDRDEVLKSYLAALVWTGRLDYMTAPPEFNGEPLVSDNVLDRLVSVDDLPDSIRETAKGCVNDFLDMIEPKLEDYPNSIELTAGSIGHDFCLTRNGQGAGFWDRGLGHLGEYLTEAAKSFGTHEVSGWIVLKNPRLPDPQVLEWDNLDHETLEVQENE